MKLKREFEIVQLGGQTVAVPVSGDNRMSFVLEINGTAEFIFKNLTEEITEDELIEKCLKEYDMPKEEISSAVKAFIETLKSNEFNIL